MVSLEFNFVAGMVDSLLGDFWSTFIEGLLGAHLEPKVCTTLESFRKEDPIVSFLHVGSEVSYATCLQESQPHN